jgi:hypothetical protein
MACDECAMNRQALEEANSQVRHLEQVLSKRGSRSDEAMDMNRILHQEIATLRSRLEQGEQVLAAAQGRLVDVRASIEQIRVRLQDALR